MSNEYPPDWGRIALAIKDESNWQCVRCGHTHDVKAGYTLTVHHLDGNKANCERWNLAALCQRCHLHIQHKVDMAQMFMFDHSEWMVPFVEGRKAALQCPKP
ncbi:MAG: HNH endonuclease [Planctomycetes bacterium]|nr:HNH endonuclease [Planctomycetota bacterium]